MRLAYRECALLRLGYPRIQYYDDVIEAEPEPYLPAHLLNMFNGLYDNV